MAGADGARVIQRCRALAAVRHQSVQPRAAECLSPSIIFLCQRHFQVSPPSVHQMIVTLERNGLIRRQPGVARSIQILVAPKDLPILDWLKINQS
ncbi:LexA family protein [Bradyrhizobium erythrophlei]|jgi:hypothetical protein|uniref:LexA DNA binding domain-containing protein n=1 Tax=Bradyrhizobium erythrophlei TaxID=1437360 RepID=A0A1M5L0Z1_9BRAD|nr:hypothetical protein [Bradyrhizobium erythrophlei]SHG58093.1 hypothetical protein SAMN05444169_3161 [Bradyrhizobium erythrophlei]